MSLPIGIVEFSLVFFIVLFVAIVVRLVFSRAERWRRDARIPLEDMPVVRDEHTGAEGGARHDIA